MKFEYNDKGTKITGVWLTPSEWFWSFLINMPLLPWTIRKKAITKFVEAALLAGLRDYQKGRWKHLKLDGGEKEWELRTIIQL